MQWDGWGKGPKKDREGGPGGGSRQDDHPQFHILAPLVDRKLLGGGHSGHKISGQADTP